MTWELRALHRYSTGIYKNNSVQFFSMIPDGPMTTDSALVGLPLDVRKNTTRRVVQPRNWLLREVVEFYIFGGIQDSMKQSHTWPFLLLMTALIWAGVWLSEVSYNHHSHDSMIHAQKRTIILTPSLVDWLRFQLLKCTYVVVLPLEQWYHLLKTYLHLIRFLLILYSLSLITTF